VTSDDRAEAWRIFAVGVEAADPARAVAAALREGAGQGDFALVIAVGKAARAMAGAALAQLPGRPRCIVVTNYENDGKLDGAEVHAAGHPVPDAAGEAAAQVVEQALHDCTEGQRVLALISGGGSALLPAPAPGLTLADKAEVSRLLLASGAEITEMNLVRQQLSRLKGGGMLRAAAPARITALILSDVIGDDIRAIASGPTAAPIGTSAEARKALEARGLWEELPQAVRDHLSAAQEPAARLPEARNRIIGSNAISLAAMGRAAPQARTAATPLTGDVAEAASRIVAEAPAPGTYLWGGETTVVLKGEGRGGRNQELALRVALEARRAGWRGFTFLSGGTDGRDGPTEAAGGLVDDGTLGRIAAAGEDAEALLARNDSNAALAAAGDLLVTGATGTNVADLQVLIRR